MAKAIRRLTDLVNKALQEQAMPENADNKIRQIFGNVSSDGPLSRELFGRGEQPQLRREELIPDRAP